MPADPTRIADPAVRALARQLAQQQREIELLKQGQRSTQLGNSSIEDGTLWFNDAAGIQRVGIGAQIDGKFGWFAVNGEAPPRPNTPELLPSVNGVTISWNGEFSGPAPSDFVHVKAYLSPVGQSFIPTEGNLVGHLLGASPLPVTPLEPNTDYWAVLIAYNTSGVASDPSFVAGPVRPTAVVATEILDGIVTRAKMADDAVDAAVLAAGSVNLEHVTFTAQDLGSIVTYAQASPPVPSQTSPIASGSLWMDTDDGNKLYRWNGLQWQPARDSDIAAALSVAQQAQSDAAAALDAAADAEAKADGVVDIFYSSTAPSGAKVGDLWFNQAAGNKVSRWNGSTWSPIDDNRIGQALANAATAQTTADGKIRSFYAATAPSGASVGDLWYDTANGNRASRWNGTSWTPLPAGANAIADDSIKTRHVTARQIQALQIAVETILAENIATDSVDARIIKALSILAEHIAANQIEAGHLKAGAVTADKLEAVLALVSTLIAGDPNGWRTEIGDAVTPFLYWDGQKTGFALSRDPVTGQSNAYLSGRIEFGNGSQIEQDYLDLCEQASTGFQTPMPRQARTNIYSEPVASVVPRWVGATGKSSLLLCSVLAANPGANGAPTIAGLSGWGSPVATVTGGASGSTRLSLYYIPASQVSRTSETISATLGGNPVSCSWSVQLVEYAGLTATPLDRFTSNSGNGTSASTGTTAATQQGNELQVGVFGTPGASSANKSGFSNFTNSFQSLTEGGGYKGQGSAFVARNAVGVGTVSVGATVTPSNPWLGLVATFRTAAAAPVPPAPPARTVRLFTQSRGGASTPFVIDSASNVYPVGRTPYCKVRLTGDFSLAANVDIYAQGAWAAAGDPWGMVAISADAGTYSNITIPVTGLYLVDFKAIFQQSTNNTSTIAAFVTKNGRDGSTNSIVRQPAKYIQDGGDGSHAHASRPIVLSAGDILYWGTFSSVNTNVYSGRLNIPTEITVAYLGVGG